MFAILLTAAAIGSAALPDSSQLQSQLPHPDTASWEATSAASGDAGVATRISTRTGVLVGAGVGCVAVGGWVARQAASDSKGAAFVTGCALGAPVGAIVGLIGALGRI